MSLLRLASLAVSTAPFDPDALDARDPEVVAAVLPRFERLNRLWLRLRVDGREHLRADPTLYVGNHNGGIAGPDLSCTLGTLWRALGPEAPLYALAHDFAMRSLPRVGRLVQALGAIRATPENAHRALASGGSVLVYPGGDLDAFRHFRDRDRVVFGPRTGFVRVAQRAGVPIVPIVAHGAHRSAIIFHEGEALARLLGVDRSLRTPRFPLALSLPWIVGAGPWVPYFPLPFPIRLRILPAMIAPPGADPASIRDAVVDAMQTAMNEMAADVR